MIRNAVLIEINFWYGAFRGNLGTKFFQFCLCLWAVEFRAAVTPFACCQNSNLLSPVKINKENANPNLENLNAFNNYWMRLSMIERIVKAEFALSAKAEG